jgi:prepilin-type N-terminal cleavage/methylation domain-containing protein
VNRRGFTLIELIVVLLVLGVIGSAIGSLLESQQQYYRGAGQLVEARQGVRDALEVLSADLRGAAVADTARLLSDSAIEVFASVGGSVVCEPGDGISVGLPAALPLTGSRLTTLLSQPDTGDLALFYIDTTVTGSSWERHRIAGFSSRSLSSVCPSSTGFSRAEDESSGATGYQVTLMDALSNHVHRGAPVRFVRRGRYSLYHASDGLWYLGYRRCNAVGASACGAIQPLSGPYRPYSGDPTATGLLFEYYTGDGARLTSGVSPLELARIDVTARAESRQRLRLGRQTILPADSGMISIAIRNRGF